MKHMPMLRKKAGPEFEGMEFDGSFECAKSIISWVGDGYDAQGAFWSSNQMMTFPWAIESNRTYAPGDVLVKRPGGIYRIGAGELDAYELVS
jgi:hypothetical protein